MASLLAASVVDAQLAAAGARRLVLAEVEPGPGLASDRFGSALAAGDFDGDGRTDLAIGIPGLALGAVEDAGGVLVLYGSPPGTIPGRHQLWTQDSTGVPDQAEPFEQFGRSLAVGDFDGDGFDDLAIGVRESFEGKAAFAGAVQILSGSEDSLAVAETGFWRQGADGLVDVPELDDLFGCFGLATGDLDGDGFDELAVGVPGEDEENGAVHLLFGSAGGLTGDGDRLFRRGDGVVPGVPPPPGAGPEALGIALAIADFDPAFAGPELAIGAPLTSLAGGVSFAGSVLLLRDVGGTPTAVELLQGEGGLPDQAESDDQFGRALAAGDFDGDGFAELAVGAPREVFDGAPLTAAGVVIVLDLSSGGGHQAWSQQVLAPEAAEAGDQFGSVVVAGDFDGDGISDLAIGVPDEDLGPLAATGTVHVLHGSAGVGLTAQGAQVWLPVTDPAHFGERFGGALVAGAFSGGASDDLAIGLPGEAGIGAVEILRSTLFADGFESGDFSEWSALLP